MGISRGALPSHTISFRLKNGCIQDDANWDQIVVHSRVPSGLSPSKPYPPTMGHSPQNPCPSRLFNSLVVLSVRVSPVVNLAQGRAIPTIPSRSAAAYKICSAFVLNDLSNGTRPALTRTDEVARNGALQRITSARGFLERPLLKVLKQPSPLPPIPQPRVSPGLRLLFFMASSRADQNCPAILSSRGTLGL